MIFLHMYTGGGGGGGGGSSIQFLLKNYIIALQNRHQEHTTHRDRGRPLQAGSDAHTEADVQVGLAAGGKHARVKSVVGPESKTNKSVHTAKRSLHFNVKEVAKHNTYCVTTKNYSVHDTSHQI